MDASAGLLGGVLASGAVFCIRKLATTLFLRNYGKVVKVVFDVLDPVAGNLMSSYNESEVQQAIELVVTRVADSKIDKSDVAAITNYVLAKFDLSLAAAKTLDTESETGQATTQLMESVSALHDGGDTEEIFSTARNAKALS